MMVEAAEISGFTSDPDEISNRIDTMVKYSRHLKKDIYYIRVVKSTGNVQLMVEETKSEKTYDNPDY